ncbi:hypothetical protein ACJX0J_036338 [Zea mays]
MQHAQTLIGYRNAILVIEMNINKFLLLLMEILFEHYIFANDFSTSLEQHRCIPESNIIGDMILTINAIHFHLYATLSNWQLTLDHTSFKQIIRGNSQYTIIYVLKSLNLVVIKLNHKTYILINTNLNLVFLMVNMICALYYAHIMDDCDFISNTKFYGLGKEMGFSYLLITRVEHNKGSYLHHYYEKFDLCLIIVLIVTIIAPSPIGSEEINHAYVLYILIKKLLLAIYGKKNLHSEEESRSWTLAYFLRNYSFIIYYDDYIYLLYNKQLPPLGLYTLRSSGSNNKG